MSKNLEKKEAELKESQRNVMKATAKVIDEFDGVRSGLEKALEKAKAFRLDLLKAQAMEQPASDLEDLRKGFEEVCSQGFSALAMVELKVPRKLLESFNGEQKPDLLVRFETTMESTRAICTEVQDIVMGLEGGLEWLDDGPYNFSAPDRGETLESWMGKQFPPPSTETLPS